MVSLQAKAILPENLSRLKKDSAFFNRLLKEAVNSVSKTVKAEFELTVKTWNKKPKFLREVSRENGNYSVTIYTDDEIYRYVTLGTPAHVIRAKNAPFLVFRTGSIPKTTPGILLSKNGFIGYDFVRKMEVRHRGTQAREFHVEIRKRAQKRLDFEIERAKSKYFTLNPDSSYR